MYTAENVRCDVDTDKALLAEFEDGSKHWIPKKVIHDDSDVYKKGTDGNLIVEDWFAEKEGLP